MLPLAQVSQHAVPLQISMGKGVATRTAYFRLPMLLPEMIWHRLWNSSSFKTYILEDANMLPRFWASCGQHPGLLKHPVKRIPNYQQSCASRAARRWCSCHVATWLEFEELPVSFVSVIDCQHSEALFDGCRMDKRVWQKQEFQHCQKHFQSGVKILCEII